MSSKRAAIDSGSSSTLSKRARTTATTTTSSGDNTPAQSANEDVGDDLSDQDLALNFYSDDQGSEEDYDDDVPANNIPSSSIASSSSSSSRPPLKLKLKLSSAKTNVGSSASGSASASSTSAALATDSQTIKSHEPDLVSNFFGHTDYRALPLKSDASSRPLYISPVGYTIILEAFHPLASQAQDFLIAISEPVSRPAHVHEYRLTKHSLQAAVSVGLEPDDIVEVLNRLCKVPVSTDVIKFIRDSTQSYGKVKLVLKSNKYFVEVTDDAALSILLKDPQIKDARVTYDGEEAQVQQSAAPKRGDLVLPGTEKPGASTSNANKNKNDNSLPSEQGQQQQEQANGEQADANEADDIFVNVNLDQNDDLDDDDHVHAFEIKEAEIENVKKRCVDIDFPMLEEYDFRNDVVNPNLDIDLKPTTTIRPYQEKSLSKMFGNGRARSGIIVLPCGAGKTLVGITAACTVKKSCLVLCTSSVSVMQWRQQFLQWSNLQDRQVAVFTSDQKEKFTGAAGVVISNYSMVANRQRRSHDAQKMMDFLTSREWGLILLDEVHVVPALMFRRVVTTIKAHAKLGLTATLVREDEKIDDLNFLIGPKLYEANWMDLASQGHIANVQCAEVWCHMTPEFFREYNREKSLKRRLLYVMNPNKFQATQFLINFHENRGDKIIVFSDNVYALEAYARKLKKWFIHGGTPQLERMRILQNFQHNQNVNCIFLSKVGDTSIDIPEATCLIQISSHFGSRRQEAQRLGRILRAKRKTADDGCNAFFYSLVSRDTEEIFYSSKRQQFLMDQGYAFKIITHLEGIKEMPDLVYPTKSEQIELLQSVLLTNENDAQLGTDVRGAEDARVIGGKRANRISRPDGAASAQRIQGSTQSLSGGQTMSYIERNRSVNKDLAKDQGSRHSLFRKRENVAKERRKQK